MKRELSLREAALWSRVASTVKPLDPARRSAPATLQLAALPADHAPAKRSRDARATPVLSPAPVLPPKAAAAPPPGAARQPPALNRTTLDAGWDRKLARGAAQPDFTLDLHGCTLDAAHVRLDHGLALALAQGARVVLLITGRPRPLDDGQSGRGERRGAIRAKFLDWLAAGSHASRIAAIRPAHPRHGGAGAVYIVLRRGR